MPDPFKVSTLQEALRRDGAATQVLPDGRKLFIVLSRNLAMDGKGILFALEGSGTLYWELDRPLNTFRLISAGFSLHHAKLITNLTNALLRPRDDINEPKRLAHSDATKDRRR